MIEDDNEYDHDREFVPAYLPSNEIPMYGLSEALESLTLFSTDMNLVSQAENLTIVDAFVMDLEYDYLRANFNETLSGYDSIFLSAQSQMWIFSAYEVMRTWMQKAKGYVLTAKNSGLHQKLKSLKRDRGYINHTAQQKADEIQALIDDPALVKMLEDDLARIYFLFSRLETLRVALAKHEARKRPNALMVGSTVAYMNRDCGSLEYQMNSGMMIQDNISRRDIADEIRAIPQFTVPTADDVKSFDLYMRGLSDDEALELFNSFEQP